MNLFNNSNHKIKEIIAIAYNSNHSQGKEIKIKKMSKNPDFKA
jgi:3D (Asp-Asp-Asp) domain-containing protein